MSSTITLELFNRAQAFAVIKEQLYPFLGHWLQANKTLTITAKLKKRTPAQNRRYWGRGVLAQVAEQATVNGRLFSAEVWHEFGKRKFLGVIDLPDGSVMSVSTTKLTTAEFSAFCQEFEAYAATELGVVFYDLERNA
jgi:hypothetical protein